MTTGKPTDEEVALRAWTQKLPKAELHIHFEGALRWETVRECHPDGDSFSLRNPWACGPNEFHDFKNFLNAFQQILQPATGTEELIERHMYEVLEDLALQNVKYVELNIGPPFHAAKGLSLEAVFIAMRKGKQAAEKDFGIRVHFVLGLQRHDAPSRVLAYCRNALTIAGPKGMNILSGVDLQGDERVAQIGPHRSSIEWARESGLSVRAHAGELAGPESVAEALQELNMKHVAHGIRAAEDKDLMKQLVADSVYLHVCPTSNVRLGVYDSYEALPLRKLFDAGCLITLNSDDPVLFGVNISDEYFNVMCLMKFEPNEIGVMAKNSFMASRMPDGERDRFIDEIKLACRSR